MTLSAFNTLSLKEAKDELFKCCGSSSWTKNLAEKIPFTSIEKLKIESDKTWFSLSEKDWLEAFSHHPKIGGLNTPEKKTGITKQWASGEQAGVNNATQAVLRGLNELNEEYEKKFGYIFIVCATGKSAEEMLGILKSRLNNSSPQEIKIAAREQNKITHLRLDKLFS